MSEVLAATIIGIFGGLVGMLVGNILLRTKRFASIRKMPKKRGGA